MEAQHDENESQTPSRARAQSSDLRALKSALVRAYLLPFALSMSLAGVLVWNILALSASYERLDASDRTYGLVARAETRFAYADAAAREFRLQGGGSEAPRARVEDASASFFSVLEALEGQARASLHGASSLEGTLDVLHQATSQWAANRWAVATVDPFDSHARAVRASLGDVKAQALAARAAALASTDALSSRVLWLGVIVFLAIGTFMVVFVRQWMLRFSRSYEEVVHAHGASERVSHALRDAQKRRSFQLETLARASSQVLASRTLQEALRHVSEHALSIVGARHVFTRVYDGLGECGFALSSPLGISQSAPARTVSVAESVGLHSLVCRLNRPFRMSGEELHVHAGRPNLEDGNGGGLPGSWLALPLIGRDGHNLGLIQLSDKPSGAFTADDEFLGLQLAQTASQAVEIFRLLERTLRDVDALRESDELLRAAVRVRDEFVATLSHELRTPLNVILGWVQILRSNQEGVSLPHVLDILDRNARVQGQLIDDLLDVSRIITGKLTLQPTLFELPAIVEAGVESVRLAALQKGILLSTRLDPGVPPLRGDPERLQQVIWNLLSNAVKFTPAGGNVRITLRALHKGTESEVEIAVENDGKGIAPAFLPHVFERFRQEDSSSTRAAGGLGLGLAIVRHIVELHGGQVRAESEGLGRGSRFVVTLPAAAEKETRAGATVGLLATRVERTLRDVRILLVEDSEDVRELVTWVLEREGAAVTPTSRLSEAVPLLETEDFDLLVSDIGLPQQDGNALVRHLRAREKERGHARLPAVALTAYARASEREASLQAGFDAHVAKPVVPDVLVRALLDLLATLRFQAATSGGGSWPSSSFPDGSPAVASQVALGTCSHL